MASGTATAERGTGTTTGRGRGRASGAAKATTKTDGEAKPRKPRKKTVMSDEHKASLALGREQSKVVRNYLDALDTHKPKRGRKRTQETVERQLEQVRNEIVMAPASKRLGLINSRLQLEQELESFSETGPDFSDLEEAFVKVAGDYARRTGISRQAFKEVGVPVDVLKKAGI